MTAIRCATSACSSGARPDRICEASAAGMWASTSAMVCGCSCWTNDSSCRGSAWLQEVERHVGHRRLRAGPGSRSARSGAQRRLEQLAGVLHAAAAPACRWLVAMAWNSSSTSPATSGSTVPQPGDLGGELLDLGLAQLRQHPGRVLLAHLHQQDRPPCAGPSSRRAQRGAHRFSSTGGSALSGWSASQPRSSAATSSGCSSTIARSRAGGPRVGSSLRGRRGSERRASAMRRRSARARRCCSSAACICSSCGQLARVTAPCASSRGGWPARPGRQDQDDQGHRAGLDQATICCRCSAAAAASASASWPRRRRWCRTAWRSRRSCRRGSASRPAAEADQLLHLRRVDPCRGVAVQQDGDAQLRDRAGRGLAGLGRPCRPRCCGSRCSYWSVPLPLPCRRAPGCCPGRAPRRSLAAVAGVRLAARCSPTAAARSGRRCTSGSSSRSGRSRGRRSCTTAWPGPTTLSSMLCSEVFSRCSNARSAAPRLSPSAASDRAAAGGEDLAVRSRRR